MLPRLTNDKWAALHLSAEAADIEALMSVPGSFEVKCSCGVYLPQRIAEVFSAPRVSARFVEDCFRKGVLDVNDLLYLLAHLLKYEGEVFYYAPREGVPVRYQKRVAKILSLVPSQKLQRYRDREGNSLLRLARGSKKAELYAKWFEKIGFEK